MMCYPLTCVALCQVVLLIEDLHFGFSVVKGFHTLYCGLGAPGLRERDLKL